MLTGPNLLCKVDRSDQITLDKTMVESVVDCKIIKLRAKAPNSFEVGNCQSDQLYRVKTV